MDPHWKLEAPTVAKPAPKPAPKGGKQPAAKPAAASSSIPVADGQHVQLFQTMCPGGGGNRHLATVPPGVGGNRRPWGGGDGHGGGRYMIFLALQVHLPRLSP